MKHIFCVICITLVILTDLPGVKAQRKFKRHTQSPKATPAKLLIRKLNTGVLSAVGIVLVARMNEVSNEGSGELL
ncbi:MAG: hypothetical protein M3362_05280, partial [Acidobacteriota bacterium]|nr:hypothetical protein [Acidobacteriota bacterium]